MASKAQRARRRMALRDAEYRVTLGVQPPESLPKKIGQADSSGAARGGRGASRKGRGRNT